MSIVVTDHIIAYISLAFNRMEDFPETNSLKKQHASKEFATRIFYL